MKTRSQSTTAGTVRLDNMLDNDTVRLIFKHVLGGADLQAALCTCKRWAAMANDEGLWRSRVLDEWAGLPTTSVSSWKSRYLTLWRAENSPPPPTDDDPDAFTLDVLNDAYEFVVHVKCSGQLLATGTAPVELTSVEAYAGEAMGGAGANRHNGVAFMAGFESPFHLPSGLFDEIDHNADPPVLKMDRSRLDFCIHVMRKADAKVAHFLTCSLVQPAYLDGDGQMSYGQAELVGVGAVHLRWRSVLARAPPSWQPLMKHALLEGPADGEMNGEVEIQHANDDIDADESHCPVTSIKLIVGKCTSFGEGPWAPEFRTPLTLPDMPSILAALSWG